MHKLLEGGVFEKLPALPRVKCLIADPPDAIGLRYKNTTDTMTDHEYYRFMKDCLYLFTIKADIVWISYNAKWTFMMGDIIQSFLKVTKPLNKEMGFEAKPFVQTFTFGQNNKHDCGNGHRPIVRIRHKSASLYPENILVPSWRMLHGDKRANPEGRVPLDVWDFPRVTGNSSQRRDYHPTQLHEGLVARMVLMSTKPGDTIYDVFSGTGTVIRVAKRAKRHTVSIENDPFYCEKLREEHKCLKTI